MCRYYFVGIKSYEEYKKTTLYTKDKLNGNMPNLLEELCKLKSILFALSELGSTDYNNNFHKFGKFSSLYSYLFNRSFVYTSKET